MITEREKEILEILRKNPLISQKDLSRRLGISRSAVASHITNLTKKSCIKGKGYILEEEPYILVMGGSNMDVSGFPAATLLQNDSNPGTVTLTPGGVGRNIAECAARIGENVKLLTMLGNDSYGNDLFSVCEKAGIDMSHAVFSNTSPSSVYLCIQNEKGDMNVAISSMEIMKELNPALIQSKLLLFSQAKLVQIDTNISEETFEALLGIQNIPPVFCDTVSITKAEKIRHFMNRLHTIKPNRLEAELLCGFELDNAEAIRKACDFFINQGVQQVFISGGSQGLFAADCKGTFYHEKAPDVTILNANGAGDALTAGILYGYIHNKKLETTVKLAQASASLALTSRDTVNHNLSELTLKKRMKELYND